MEQKKKNKMEVMPMGKLVAEMSIPMMLSLLIQSLYNIVDSIFVSRIGEQALTATSLAYPLQMLMIAVGVGTAVGLNAVLSRTLGAKDYEAAENIATTGILLAFLSSMVFMIVGLLFGDMIAYALTDNAAIAGQTAVYLKICMIFSIGNLACMMYQRLLQSTGKTLLSMLVLVAGAVTNIVLDPIMIFGYFGCPAMGIRGAAIATVTGQWVSMFVGYLLQRYCNREVRVSFHNFRVHGEYVKKIYKIGFPTIITQAMQSMMVTSVNAILQPFSTTAVAFFGVYYKLQMFLFMPMNGLGQALIPIVAFNYGAKNKKRITSAIRTVYPVAAVVALAGTVLFCGIPEKLLGLFSAQASMLELGVPAIRIIALTFLPAAITMISGYLSSGLQNGVTNMASAFIRQFCPLIPCAWILASMGGISNVWYAFWISELCAVFYAVLRIRKLLHKVQ